MSQSPNFDPLARPYRWLEYLTFGPCLQRTRTHYLPQLAHCCQALVLGDGDGRFTAALLRANPTIQIHSVDISPAMLRAAKKSAHPHQNRLTTEQADLRFWQPKGDRHYDLITTHFLLDCLTKDEITRLATCLAPIIHPDARWLVSEFAIPQNHFGYLFVKPLITLLYLAFRLLTQLNIQHLPDHAKALTSQGWQLQQNQPHLNGLLTSQLWDRNHAFGIDPIDPTTPA